MTTQETTLLTPLLAVKTSTVAMLPLTVLSVLMFVTALNYYITGKSWLLYPYGSKNNTKMADHLILVLYFLSFASNYILLYRTVIMDHQATRYVSALILGAISFVLIYLPAGLADWCCTGARQRPSLILISVPILLVVLPIALLLVPSLVVSLLHLRSIWVSILLIVELTVRTVATFGILKCSADTTMRMENRGIVGVDGVEMRRVKLNGGSLEEEELARSLEAGMWDTGVDKEHIYASLEKVGP